MLKDGYTEWPSIIRMADDNMVRDPMADLQPPEQNSPTQANAAMAAMLRAISPRGMVDAYRHTDPGGRATTYTRVAKTGEGSRCRYDVFDVSCDLTNSNARLVRTRHQSQDETMIYYLKGATRHAKRSDHAQVAITLRYTDIPRPPRTYSMPQDILEGGIVDTEVIALLETAGNIAADEIADVDAFTESWQQRANGIFKRLEKQRRQAEFAVIDRARKQMQEAQVRVPPSLSSDAREPYGC